MRILSLLTLVYLVACSPPGNEAEIRAIESEKDQPVSAEYEEEGEPGFDYGEFEAITIRKTSTYENPDLTAEANGSIPANMFVVVDAKGEREAVDSDEDCLRAGYHWYSVSEGGDAPSWVYGADIYLRRNAQDFLNNDMTTEENDFGYKTGGSFYRFDMAASTFEEAEEAEEQLLCYSYGMPFFYMENLQNVFPIYVTDKLLSNLGDGLKASEDNILLLILDSDYCATYITDFIEVESGKYKINIKVDSSDGVEELVLSVNAENGGFHLVDMQGL